MLSATQHIERSHIVRRVSQSLAVRAGLSATAWIAITVPVFGAAALYRCHAKDAVSLEDDGTLGRQRGTGESIVVIVDTATGVIRYGNGDPETWQILQKGDPGNDFVAAPITRIPDRAPADMIRIRAWAKLRTALFSWYHLSGVITGICEPIK